ncbi:MAG: 4Fe-4S dicluster domain-containing protein [Desulfotomaculaceae bacterium]|nr:4Fe-4S dicluster domain-containing protein [Desulfotomaculaceae bacterium]
MGHTANAKDEVYRALAERLHMNPVGAPINLTLMEILHRIYTESEALVGSKFPLIPMTLDTIAGITGVREEELKKILDSMADKGLVVDLPRRDGTYYTLAPMVIGFFEFTFMRTGDGVNLKELAELFDRYFRTPRVAREFFGSDTKLMRTLVYERLIPAAVETEVLSYEKASEIIRQSGGGALSLCACRHKASHLGKSCAMNAPMDVCTSLGETAEWIVRRGLGKPASVDELLQVLEQTEKLGLVHLGDNVLNEPWYICHCCGCCCSALGPTRKYGLSFASPSSFIPVLGPDICTGCGACAGSCQIKAIVMRDAGSGIKAPEIQQKCIGCGICASACPSGALTMSRRPAVNIPPVDKTDLLTRIAREKDRMHFKLGPV